MINMSANSLGARFLYMQIIFEPIKMKFRNNLVSKLSRLLKNLQLSRFQLGMVPIVTKVFKPWMDEQEQPWWSQRPSKRAKTAGRQSCGERRDFSWLRPFLPV